MRITVGELKTAANWEQVLNLRPSDPRWLQYLNEALERLLPAGIFAGTTCRYQFCTRSSCVTIPRQFRTFEVVDVCGQPVPIRNQWFEFLENGPGLARRCGTGNSCDGGLYVLTKGRGYAAFNDLPFAQNKIRLFLTQAIDAGRAVTIRGYDSNSQWVQTAQGTVEGESMTLGLPYTDSATIWGKQVLRSAIKSKTRGFVRAYFYDATEVVASPNDYTLYPLAVWEPSETVPDYRRYEIPAIRNMNGGCCGSTATDPVTVNVIARLQHISVEVDLDFLPISNVSALKLAMRSIMLKERGDDAGSRNAFYGVYDPVKRRYLDGAIPILEDELDAEQGAGTVSTLRLERGDVDRATVYNMI